MNAPIKIIAEQFLPSVLDQHPPKRIGVFRAGNLADFLLAIPAVRVLRRRFPEAEISLITLPEVEPLTTRFNHYIDRFLQFPGYPGILESEFDVKQTGRFLLEQRAYGYDLAIQMQGCDLTSNSFTLEFGARLTVGYCDGRPPMSQSRPLRMDSRWYAADAVWAVYPHGEPEILVNLRLLEPLGCRYDLSPDSEDVTLEFPLTHQDHVEARTLLPGGAGTCIGLQLGSGGTENRWSTEHFATLAEELAGRYGARIVLTGGPNEREIVSRVTARMRAEATNLAGKTSLGTLAAVIQQMDLFISDEIGLCHLANAVGTPAITVNASDCPVRLAPLDQTLHRIICPSLDYGNQVSVQPGRVLDMAVEMLSTSADRPRPQYATAIR